jgi:F0F1-type ATP synthase assembly protein I
MNKSLWLGGVLAGVAVFAWGFVSWTILPFHESTLLAFKDEAAVTAVLAANAPAAGVYLLPNAHAGAETAEQRKQRMDAAMKQWESGPSAIMAVSLARNPSMASNITLGLVTQIVGGLLIAFLLSKTGGLGYWGKVGFTVVVGVTVGVLSLVPEWNWWGFSMAYVGATFLDYVVGWFLGGLVLAKFG